MPAIISVSHGFVINPATKSPIPTKDGKMKRGWRWRLLKAYVWMRLIIKRPDVMRTMR